MEFPNWWRLWGMGRGRGKKRGWMALFTIEWGRIASEALRLSKFVKLGILFEEPQVSPLWIMSEEVGEMEMEGHRLPVCGRQTSQG